jgi:hypothetical protein
LDTIEAITLDKEQLALEAEMMQVRGRADERAARVDVFECL